MKSKIAFVLLLSIAGVLPVTMSAAGSLPTATAALVESPFASSRSLPKGTILYLRLKTPVSTASSKVHQKVIAETVRQIFAAGRIVVPIGAQVTGAVAQLHAGAAPDDPATMLIRFTKLELPGEKPIDVSCHLSEVENARETVLKDGTIQGVTASDLGATYVDQALSKLAQQLPSLSDAIGSFEKKQIGTPDATIRYPAGTDIQIELDKALPLENTFAPVAANQLPKPVLEAVQEVLAKAPDRSTTEKKTPGDPINLVLVGSANEIRQAFQRAGWDVPAIKQTQSIAKTVQAVVQGGGYGVAPISNLYLFGRPQDLAFEKVLNTFAMRHHLRLWQAPVTAPDATPVWLGAAVHDTGFDIHPGVASHATDPDLDAERAKVGADLLTTGLVAAEQLIAPPHPLSHGITGTGGAWHTDGRLLVVDFGSKQTIATVKNQ